jgi:hypothetical protein
MVAMAAVTIAKNHASGTDIPLDLSVVCLWAVVGLAAAALLTLGFDADIASALAVAG